MPAQIWSPGEPYALGEIIQPRTTPAPVQTAIPNAGFETGTASWTGIAGSWSIDTSPVFEGAQSLRFNGSGTGTVTSTVLADVLPGQVITLKARTRLDAGSFITQPQVFVGISWYTSGSVFIKTDYGDKALSSPLDAWQQILVVATAPATAAFARPILKVDATATVEIHFDSLAWDQTYSGPIGGLLYQCTTAGTSSAVEPVWPTTVAATVADGSTLVWTAVQSNRVVWTAVSLLRSGASEPTWPTIPGALVADNTTQWECVTQEVKDPNCPRTKVIAVGASKIFAVAGDVVRYCSTVDALDWTSAGDAGYLPTGLHQYGNNDALVLGVYRGNLCVWSSSTFQMWQIDPDPANMALLDQMEGIGSTYPLAAQPVGEEQFFMAAQGVRSVGISAASDNLQTGDIGKPVDSLIQAHLTAGQTPEGLYVPALGQLWMMFTNKLLTAFLDDVLYDEVRFVIDVFAATSIRKELRGARGIRPYTYSEGVWSPSGTTGLLPSWASIDPDTGDITGTPGSLATVNSVITITDAAGRTKRVNIRFQDGS